jgi:hypothetical protein
MNAMTVCARLAFRKWYALGPQTRARFVRLFGSEYFAAMRLFGDSAPKSLTSPIIGV